MRKTTEILRLKHEVGLTHRQIARSCGLTHPTVSKYLERAQRAGLVWPLPEDVDEEQLQALLFPETDDGQRSSRPLPDAARATQTFERRFQALARVPLLIIDDFGLKPLQPPQDDDFHELISERYERTATIVTSNLAFEEWGTAFSNRLLAAATLDRLRHAAYCVVLDGHSYRAPKPAHQPKKTHRRKEAS